jgi:hypothetical protein
VQHEARVLTGIRERDRDITMRILGSYQNFRDSEKRVAYLADEFGSCEQLLEFVSEDFTYFPGNFSRFASCFQHERRFQLQA